MAIAKPTEEQLAKLNTLTQQLTDLFLDECDISKFPGLDTRDGRGDRLWLKKNAAKTLALVCQIVNMTARVEEIERREWGSQPAAAPPEADQPSEDPVADLIRDAEERAERMMRQHAGKTSH